MLHAAPPGVVGAAARVGTAGALDAGVLIGAGMVIGAGMMVGTGVIAGATVAAGAADELDAAEATGAGRLPLVHRGEAPEENMRCAALRCLAAHQGRICAAQGCDLL